MRFASTKTRLRLAWLLAPAFFLSAEPSGGSLAIGALPLTAGILLRAWAASHILKDRELAVHGPYAHMRHPLWTGSFLVLMGLTLAGGAWYCMVSFPLLFLATYIPAAREEEKRLTLLFGDAYRVYRAETPAIWPRLGGRGIGGKSAGAVLRGPVAPPLPVRRVPPKEVMDSKTTCEQHPTAISESGGLPQGCSSHRDGSERWRLYFRNGEWQAAVGSAAAFLILWLRMQNS